MRRILFLTILLAILASTVCAQTPTALIRNGRTLIPLRSIAEWLGATVDFDAATHGVAVTLNEHTVKVVMGSVAAVVDGTPIQLDVAAIEKAGTTYVPARFVSEAFGAQVAWEPVTRKVTVTHPTNGTTFAVSVPKPQPTAHHVASTHHHATATTASGGSRTVYVTRTGSKYHAGGCQYLARSQIPITRADAIAQGYTPCSVCAPGGVASAPSVRRSASSNSGQSSARHDVTVYITRTGAKYHAGGCRYLSRSCIPIALSLAKAQGYDACSVCGPPQ